MIYSLQEGLTDVWKTPENQQLNLSSSDNRNVELYSCAAVHLIVRLTQVKHREAASVMSRREERVWREGGREKSIYTFGKYQS